MSDVVGQRVSIWQQMTAIVWTGEECEAWRQMTARFQETTTWHRNTPVRPAA